MTYLGDAVHKPDSLGYYFASVELAPTRQAFVRYIPIGSQKSRIISKPVAAMPRCSVINRAYNSFDTIDESIMSVMERDKSMLYRRTQPYQIFKNMRRWTMPRLQIPAF
jgi:hypothetical protein